MPVDIPIFNRCCFCIPLRYGIIVWGYFKLISGLIALYPIVVELIFFVKYYETYGDMSGFKWHLLLILLFLLLFVMDTVLCIIFLVGAHTKNPRLLRMYYFYSVFVIVVTTVLFVVYMGYSIYALRGLLWHIGNWTELLPTMATGMLNIILQLYLILLVRSEIHKLNNNINFRFENHAAESVCVMSGNFDDHKDNSEKFDDEHLKHVDV